MNCMATLKHIASVARAAASFNHKLHICDIQFDVVANDLNNRIVIKTRTTLPLKRISFTSTMRSLGSNFWMNRASRSCGNPTIGKLIDIQSRMTEGKGIVYKRWLTKHNLKIMAQTVKLLQEKDLTDEDVLNQRIAELETKYHDSLAVVKDLEGRMKANKELRYHVAAYTSTKGIVQQFNTAKRPAAFEEQHRAELTAYRAAAAYFKANNLTKLPSPKKLEAEYAQLASEKAKFYEQYKEAKRELLKLKTAKQNVASFFREEEPAQQER